MFAKLGFTSEANELSDFEVAYLTSCYAAFEGLKREDLKKARKK